LAALDDEAGRGEGAGHAPILPRLERALVRFTPFQGPVDGVCTATATMKPTMARAVMAVLMMDSTSPAVASPPPVRAPPDRLIERRAETDTMIPGTPAKGPKHSIERMPSTRPHTALGSVRGAA